MRVLFVTKEYVGPKRAGPAIRAVELARVLSKHHEVTLASSQPGELETEGIRFIQNALANPRPLRAAAKASDIIVTHGLILYRFPFLKRARHLVIELYDPYLFEYLEKKRGRYVSWTYLRQWHLLNDQLRRGDFFMCASEQQWDYWLGRLCALGRLTPALYQRDPTFRSLLSVIPFGIPRDPPRHTKATVKGVIPGIFPSDILLLWGGGIWQWLDPLTLIRAMELVSRQRPDIKLLFLGTKHPTPTEPEMPVLKQTIGLARELGVLNRSVFFNEDWAAQAELENYLTEADIGVSTHQDTVETRFAFRTRATSYLWAGLPMILTRGDFFAEFVEQHRLGRTVPPGDAGSLTNAILELAAGSDLRLEIRRRVLALAPQFHWETVAKPLVEFCDRPYRPPRPSGWRESIAPWLNRGYQLIWRGRDR